MVRSYLPSAIGTFVFCCSTQLPAAEPPSSENRVFFATQGEAAAASKSMAERLADPAQRAKLREEQRASVEQQHPDVTQVLQIDASVAAKLFDVLADQQVERLAEGFGRARNFSVDMQDVADAEDRRLDQQREILGDEGLERYQDYSGTRTQRNQVNTLDARLSARDKLRPEQKERLIMVLADAMARDINTQRLAQGLPSSRLGQFLPSREDMQRFSQLSTIEMNQDTLLRRQESNRTIEQNAAAFLTPTQLALLAKIHEENDASLRQWIEKARLQAGLDPAIPDHHETLTETLPPRVPVVGDIEVTLRVVVNRSEPVAISFVGANGQSRLFEAGKGFFIEAVPTLFDDDSLNVHLHYYELGVNGQRRRLNSSGGFTTRMKTDAGRPVPNTGDSTTMATGKRAYSIVINAKAERA